MRELSFKGGEPDYSLFVDGRAIGTIEAKPVGHSLTGVEEQSEKYVKGVPFGIPAWRLPLPFSYESTGTESRFTNRLDPLPRSRNVFAFHCPEALLGWMENYAAPQPVGSIADYATRKGNFLSSIQHMPPLIDELWPPKPQAIMNLEQSLRDNRPRSLVQMATGSGSVGVKPVANLAVELNVEDGNFAAGATSAPGSTNFIIGPRSIYRFYTDFSQPSAGLLPIQENSHLCRVPNLMKRHTSSNVACYQYRLRVNQSDL